MQHKENMSIPQENINNTQQEQPKIDNKEFNFRQLEKEFNRKLAEEREARIALERQLAERDVPTDDDSDPYVDTKKLEKKLNAFGQDQHQKIKNEIKREMQTAFDEERKNQWLKNNGDFYEVMSHAQKLADADPELAETILRMPEGFEREKLVYKTIKSHGYHKPAPTQPSAQEMIDKNRRGAFYQPSDVAAPPYGVFSSGARNVSAQEGKNLYAQMKSMSNKMRLG